MVDFLKQKGLDDFREGLGDQLSEDFRNSSWCVCPQASHSDWSSGDGSEGLPEEGGERRSAENSAWAADPGGTLSSRKQGRVSQDDKGKGGETWSSKGQGPGGGEAPGGTGGRIGGQREGARRGVPRMRRSLAKEFRLLTATPMDPV